MIANVSAHRRANAFAQALEEPSGQGKAAEQPEASAEEAERDRMVALASGLADVPRPALDADVKVVQRAQLVAAMEAMLLEGTAAGEAAGTAVPEQRSRRGAKGAHRASPLSKLRPRSRLSKGLAAGGLTVGVAAGALGGVAAASTDALPGDHLYGLKRGMEDFRLDLADGDSDRGQIYLDQASTRLGEARRLMERDRSGRLDHESLGEVRRALTAVGQDASEGHRLLFAAYERDGSLAPIQALSAFAQTHRDSWTSLRDRLPVQLGDVSDQVSSAFDAIDQEVDPLRPLLPKTPSQDHGSRDPGSGRTSDQPSGTDRPEPSATGGASAGGHGDSGRPEPSGSGSASGKDDGLLPDDPGGLLDPPGRDGGSSTPSDGRDGRIPRPDVTVPPLLPGLLPGLGIDSEDDG